MSTRVERSCRKCSLSQFYWSVCAALWVRRKYRWNPSDASECFFSASTLHPDSRSPICCREILVALDINNRCSLELGLSDDFGNSNVVEGRRSDVFGFKKREPFVVFVRATVSRPGFEWFLRACPKTGSLQMPIATPLAGCSFRSILPRSVAFLSGLFDFFHGQRSCQSIASDRLPNPWLTAHWR
jgi:hypothetical protein